MISLVLALIVDHMLENKAEAEFDYQVSNVQLAIEKRIRSYVDVLRGTKALFYTSDRITREQFHAYAAQLELETYFPGIKSLNFGLYVPASKKQAFEAAVRADTSLDPRGYPAFAIKPPSERPAYHVLTYLEPIETETNKMVFGLDIGSRDFSFQALALQRDTGRLHSSGRLISIGGPSQYVGIAMRMPLYHRGMPTNNIEERRAAYYGSVGLGIDINKLMLGVINEKGSPDLRLKIYDVGPKADSPIKDIWDPKRLLFDSAAAEKKGASRASAVLLTKSVHITSWPRAWEAEFSVDKTAMMSAFDIYLPSLVLLTGLLTSSLLFSSYYSLASARQRAVELASDMTKDLRVSETSLAEAQQMAHLGNWLLDPDTRKMTWSTETFRIFGLTRFVGGPDYSDFLLRIHEEDRQRVRAGFEKSLSNGDEFNIEHRIRQHDGSIRWVQTISRPTKDDSKVQLRGTIMDITQRKQTVEALQRSQELLRELTAYQDRVKEDERRRIAREIHDELGQTLLVLRIDVSMLEARTSKSHRRLNEKVRASLQHIDNTVKTIRTIINNLRPSVLDLGLTAALEWQVNEFRRRSDIVCELTMNTEDCEVDETRATALFRILQESLTNILRHANASRVDIELRKEGNELIMQIADDGIGIDQALPRKVNSFGLVGAQERVHALNGTFVITSAPGKGTTLTIHIPLEKPEKQAALV